MLYRILFHCCWIIISFIIAAFACMALYTYGIPGLMRNFLLIFGVLEVLHILMIVRKQFAEKKKALLLNNFQFTLLALVSGFVVYFYANVSSWRNDGDTSVEFRYFSYFFDNIFLVNLVILIANFWFLCRNLIVKGFERG